MSILFLQLTLFLYYVDQVQASLLYLSLHPLNLTSNPFQFYHQLIKVLSHLHQSYIDQVQARLLYSHLLTSLQASFLSCMRYQLCLIYQCIDPALDFLLHSSMHLIMGVKMYRIQSQISSDSHQ
jgi:hypothetical protein